MKGDCCRSGLRIGEVGVCCGLGGAFDVGCGLWARTVEGVVGRAKGDGRILGETIVDCRCWSKISDECDGVLKGKVVVKHTYEQ